MSVVGINKRNTKNIMPNQPPEERNKNFNEVALGFDKNMAVDEARRCLNCKNKPCMDGCPVNVDIPEFIKKIAENDFDGAYDVIYRTNSLPAVCGRVCPQESQCEGKCVRAIKGESVAIGALERFAADFHLKNNDKNQINIQKSGIKAAVIGSGPASLSCAGDLARYGYDVTIFEAFHTSGGVLVYGIPEFRLPKYIVNAEIENLKSMGVEIKTNVVIGKSITFDEIFELGYKAVFIGTGAGLPHFMNIEGEGLVGVFSANEYLTRINLMKAYSDEYETPVFKSEKVAVAGGGNVAMDAARCAKRMGAEKVYIVYRRTEDEMPARAEEVHHAKEEGIEFITLAVPVKINGDDKGFVKSITCVKMELGEAESDGRRKPFVLPDSEFNIEADTVIMALGTSPNPLISSIGGFKTNKRGCLEVNEQGETSVKGIFAGGDTVTGAATVIQAMGAGKTAAKAMHEYISQMKN